MFGIKPKRFLGIDIGTTSLRVVELRRKGKKIWLNNYAEIPSVKEDFLNKEGEDSYDQIVAKNIKEVCKIAKIFTKNTNIAIPDFYTFYATFNLPNMAKEEIMQAIQYEVRPHIPLPISEITLDWTIIEGEISKTPLKVLVVAIPNEIISKYRNIANLAGLKLKFLEPEVSSLYRSLIGKEEETKTVAIMDMGEKSTTCSIIENNILKVSHSFRIGGIDFTKILAKSLDISYNNAKKAKLRYGIAENDKIKEIFSTLLDSCVSEIEKVFRDYYKNGGNKIENLIIFGGGSLLKGLNEYLFSKLEVKVSYGDPFKNIFYSSILEKIGQNRKMSLAIPIGVAIKGFK